MKIVVTGGSGFVGSHTITQLLAAGHDVRTTVRSPQREPVVRAMVNAADDARLTCVVADLDGDEGWGTAVAGCDYVLHVASPFPAGTPKHDDDLIIPAREGTLRVLRAARDAGVKRVVLTSSFAAIGYGQPPQREPFVERSWSDPSGQPAYIKSKTLAERAAWDFIAREGGALELAVVNPVGIFGPVLGPDFSGSIGIVKAMLEGAMPFCPKLMFGVVDVRDVADLHLRAMVDPAAKGERFLATAGDFISMLDIAKILGRRMRTTKVPKRELPSWLVRLLARFMPPLRETLPELGKTKQGSNAKARRLLGWAPRSSEDAIVATAESLVRLGLLKSSLS